MTKQSTKHLLSLNSGIVKHWRYGSVQGATSFLEICSFKGHTDSVAALALDGRFLYSASADRTVRCWDVRNEFCLQTSGVTKVYKSTLQHLAY